MIPEVALRSTRGRGKPCSVCGLVKRHELNRMAHEFGLPGAVTGHNLDDEAAVLWGNTLNWQMQYLARQAPVLPADQPAWPQGQTAVPFLRARRGKRAFSIDVFDAAAAAYAAISRS